MRTWQEIVAQAAATGTWDTYRGDGFSVPWQVAFSVSPAHGLGMWAYKLWLDAHYPEAARIHDWCYTPYGRLINVSRQEADAAIRDRIAAYGGPFAAIDSQVVWISVTAGGWPYFGTSQTGFDNELYRAVTGAIWELPTMPIFKCTVGFETINISPPAGFTETWYLFRSQGTLADQIADVTAAMQRYITERAVTLSSDWNAGAFLRISQMVANCVRKPAQVEGQYCCKPATEGKVQCLCPQPVRGKQGRMDQAWDGLLIELCTEPFFHSSCNCEPGREFQSVRRWIMRGVPDTWWINGAWAVPNAAKNDVQRVLKMLGAHPQPSAQTIGAGTVACADACDVSPDSSCGELVFQPYRQSCVKYDRPAKRATGRPFVLLRGRRSPAESATQ